MRGSMRTEDPFNLGHCKQTAAQVTLPSLTYGMVNIAHCQQPSWIGQVLTGNHDN